MDEKNTMLPEDNDFLKSLEADHMPDAHFDLSTLPDSDKTQIFSADSFAFNDNVASDLSENAETEMIFTETEPETPADTTSVDIDTLSNSVPAVSPENIN